MGIQINGQTDTVTATDGSINIGGDVTVPGVLTYEDVTSVDAVGLSTFQNGIHVTGGSVGIGTDNPSAPLHLSGADAGNAKIKIEDNNNGFAASEINIANGGRDLRIAAPQDIYFQDVDTGEKHLYIESGGNIGIGTDNPSHKLDVVGNTQLYGTLVIGDNTDISPTANGAGQLHIDGNGYTPYIAADGTAMYIGHNSTSRDLRLQTNETDRLTIDGSTGNIGIGTDNPRYGLDVYTNNILVSGSSAGNLILEDRGVADGSRPFALLASNDGNFTITNANRNASGTTTSSVERLRIDSNGVVTIPGQPIMEVYAVTSGSTSVSGNSATTLIPFNAANTYDPGNDMNVSTGVYTVPADGRYLLHYGTEGKTAANSNAGSIYYNLNGGGINGQCLYYGEAYSGNSKQVILNLSAGDEIIWQIYGNNNQSYSINAANYGIQMIG